MRSVELSRPVKVRIYRISANLGEKKERGDNVSPPSPILAPGTALGSVPTVALSSAQVMSILTHGEKKEIRPTKIRRRLFDPSCLQLEIPPVWANSNVSLDAAATASGLASQHVALDGVAPTARNSHQINPRLPYPGRASHGYVSGTSRRNVLGAIAYEKNDRNFPQRRQSSRTESNPTLNFNLQSIDLERTRRKRRALFLRNNPDGNHSRLTDSYRKGHIDRAHFWFGHFGLTSPALTGQKTSCCFGQRTLI